MSLINYTIKTKDNQLKQISRKHFTHLTTQQRKNMAHFLRQGFNKTQISIMLGVHRTTVQREFKRGLYNTKTDASGRHFEYCDDVADNKAKENKKKAKRKPILNSESPFIKVITLLVKTFGCSLFVAHSLVQRLKDQIPILEGQKTVSLITLYKYAHKGILKLHKKAFPYGLKIKGQNQPKEGKMVQKGDNISLRPEEANNRTEFGHWEGDLVLGSKKGSKECVLTLVERQTRTFLAFKIKDKTHEAVKAVFDQLEKKLGCELFRVIFKTITFDNGKEFVQYEELECSIFGDKKRFKTYYANPYHSWERGSNENSNRWFRRFFPKGTDFGKVTQDEIDKALGVINYTVRRKLNNRSSAEMLDEQKIPLLDILEIENPYAKICLILGLSY